MRLAVNIDHFATLREARKQTEPEPVLAALLAEQAGAEGIVCHLRSDRRHIKERDLLLLREAVKTKLNLEMAATAEMQKIALKVKPDVVSLVPERREELTTESSPAASTWAPSLGGCGRPESGSASSSTPTSCRSGPPASLASTS
jgi:pyridoxine 5-phosphate synthase